MAIGQLDTVRKKEHLPCCQWYGSVVLRSNTGHAGVRLVLLLLSCSARARACWTGTRQHFQLIWLDSLSPPSETTGLATVLVHFSSLPPDILSLYVRSMY
jgi:hypothetical protein